MFSKFSNSIQMKMLTSIVLLSLVIVSLVLGILNNARQSEKISNEKNAIVSLSDSLRNVQRSSAIYLSNAARDYESYFRDLDVFYKVTKSDLSLIDEKVTNLSQTIEILTNMSQNSFNFVRSSEIDSFKNEINKTRDEWQQFKTELGEKFGEKENEPRLEWGARYIVDSSSTIAQQFEQLGHGVESISNQQNRVSAISGQIVVAILIFFTAAFAAFFYLQIIKPIRNTKSAFQRVSDGDFGYQIEAKKQDEIGQLITSFNQMSARSNTVLSILSKLQSVESTTDVVNTLYSELNGYLGCDLVVYIKANYSGEGYMLSDVAPQNGFKHLQRANVAIENTAQKEYMLRQIKDGAAIQIDSIEEFMKLNKNAIVLKTLVTRYPLKSAIVQPLNELEDGAMIIFASYHVGQLTEKHLELLNHLMPFITHKITALGLPFEANKQRIS